MTVLIVDLLEMVDIEEGQDQRLAGPVGSIHRLPQLVLSSVAQQGAGQFVPVGVLQRVCGAVTVPCRFMPVERCSCAVPGG